MSSINSLVSSLEDDLKAFWQDSSDGSLCDITMVVGETHIRAHKVDACLCPETKINCVHAKM